MKQLCVIGTVGNNLAVVELPTAWSVEEAKNMLEMALKVFNGERTNKEFVTVSSEEELRDKFPVPTSKLINLCNKLMKEIGKPNESSGIIWQFNTMQYLSSNPAFTKDLVAAFRHVNKEEREFINSNYLEFLEKITSNLYC